MTPLTHLVTGGIHLIYMSAKVYGQEKFNYYMAKQIGM